MKRLPMLFVVLLVLACENTSTTAGQNDLDRTDNDDTVIMLHPPAAVTGAKIDSFTKDSLQPEKR